MIKKGNILFVILVLGMLISLFLISEHFAVVDSDFCSFGGSFDCGSVNKSPYANLDGIFYLLAVDFGFNISIVDIKGINWFFDLITSNAFLGFLVLLLLFIMFYSYKTKKNFLFIKYNKILLWMRNILIFSFIYGMYLLLVQHFILKTYCLFCLGLDVVIILSLILVWEEGK